MKDAGIIPTAPSTSLRDLDQSVHNLFSIACDRAIAFRQGIRQRPHQPEKDYTEMRRLFASELPTAGESAETVIKELADLSEPGLAAMTGPRFFGWVIGASHPAGVAADWLASAWGQNTGSHAATPSASACEEVAAKWLLELLDLPRESSVGFASGATMANFVCLAAARDQVLRNVGWDVEEDGLFGAPAIRIIIGEDAHTSLYSALRYLGLGTARNIKAPTDEMGRIRAKDFCEIIRAGAGPTIVIAQAGQINTGGFDPWNEIIPAARERGAWVHVDGAFGLWARACPARSALAAGCEMADSWATDGHKWLQTPYDCGYAIVRHEEAHRRAMTTTASYLTKASPDERNPSDYVPELSRRARGFATWAIIRALGREGIAAMIERHCRLARKMADGLAREPGISVLNDVPLNQAIVRFGESGPSPRADELTRRTIERVQNEGTCFVSGAGWRDRWVMRLSVISWPTTDADIDRSQEAIIAAWRLVRETYA
jgi:glutamate/tyrosine decarboxylase-like PLP-dependent enzyme